MEQTHEETEVDPSALFASLSFSGAEGGKPRLTASEKRQEQFKRTSGDGDQTKRREKLLSRQRDLRRDLTSLARSLALESPIEETLEEEEEEEAEQPPATAISSGKEKRKREEEEDRSAHTQEGPSVRKAHRVDEEFVQELKAEKKAFKKERTEEKVRARYRGTFMLPEEMARDELPLDLAESWVCVPVPSGGKRCLVISAKGQTTSRLRNGAVLHRFSSGLPSGNTAKFSVNNPTHYCILDCVFHEPSLTYYVLDIQCWRGNLYYDCDTSFRFACASSHISKSLSPHQHSVLSLTLPSL
jgi:snurportin-1